MEQTKIPSVRVGFRLPADKRDAIRGFSPRGDLTEGIYETLRYAEIHKRRREPELQRVLAEIQRLRVEFDIQDDEILDLKAIKAAARADLLEQIKKAVRDISRNKVKAFIREYELK